MENAVTKKHIGTPKWGKVSSHYEPELMAYRDGTPESGRANHVLRDRHQSKAAFAMSATVALGQVDTYLFEPPLP